MPHSRWPAPLHLLPGMLQAPTVSLRDKLSNARVSWFAMRMGDEDVAWLDAMAADEFLRRMGVSERFIKWFWASAAIAIENVPLELCSAGALLSFTGT